MHKVGHGAPTGGYVYRHRDIKLDSMQGDCRQAVARFTDNSSKGHSDTNNGTICLKTRPLETS